MTDQPVHAWGLPPGNRRQALKLAAGAAAGALLAACWLRQPALAQRKVAPTEIPVEIGRAHV